MRTSILIVAHNEGESLWQTVRACIETCGGMDCEIIVADDASTDGSVEQAQHRYPTIRVVRHPRSRHTPCAATEGSRHTPCAATCDRQGVAPTRRLAVAHARGDALVFLDGHTNPAPGAIPRLVEDLDLLDGRAIVTPKIPALDVDRWANCTKRVGHGYRLELENFDTGWLPLEWLIGVECRGRRLYESPAPIGCALAVSRELHDELWGFDGQMRDWGIEDIDFGLKCWLMGYPILHDPEAAVGHRFQQRFASFEMPHEIHVANRLRMARKHFTSAVWNEWLERSRQRSPQELLNHPEGFWARVWELFEESRASAESERSYLLGRRVRDEFWYAERFSLPWPKLNAPAYLGGGLPASPTQRPAGFGQPESPPEPSEEPPEYTVDLVIHNGLDGYSGGQEISEDDEETLGALTVANENDTDGNGAADLTQNDSAGVVATAAGRDEIDLMKLIVKKPDPDDGGDVTLTITVGEGAGQVPPEFVESFVKLWKHSTKKEAFDMPNGTRDIPTSDLDMTLWVEARIKSSAMRDIKIQ